MLSLDVMSVYVGFKANSNFFVDEFFPLRNGMENHEMFDGRHDPRDV